MFIVLTVVLWILVSTLAKSGIAEANVEGGVIEIVVFVGEVVDVVDDGGGGIDVAILEREVVVVVSPDVDDEAGGGADADTNSGLKAIEKAFIGHMHVQMQFSAAGGAETAGAVPAGRGTTSTMRADVAP